MRQDACVVRTFGSLGAAGDLRSLVEELTLFGSSVERDDPKFSSFVAVFPVDVPQTEVEFDRCLWQQLQFLSNEEGGSASWDALSSDDPESPDFSFSFAGVAYFVVGLFPESSRMARRFTWPTLIFNPHSVFDRLRSDGNYERMKSMIRERDRALQGDLNPNLADFGESSEARQYSGMKHDESWKCPFHRAK